MNQDDVLRFCKYLKQLRQKRKLSIRALASKAGLNSGAVTRLEHGERQPRPDTLQALAAALEVPLVDLYAMTSHTVPYDLPSMAPYLRARYGHLPEEKIEAVNNYLERLLKEHDMDPRGPLAHEDEIRESSKG